MLHLTPPSGWLSDPNGLIRLADGYHAFYQHNPHGTDWGPMHWGHARSTDLVVWEHLGIAMHPDETGMAFSGSCTLDPDNCAGLGAGALVAALTRHLDGHESQFLAASHDGGRSWVSSEHNPVLVPPEGIRDFRDPRVLRWDGPEGPWWVMLLGVGPAIRIYVSQDLLSWSPVSQFGRPLDGAEIWETPELQRVPVEGTGEHRWVLSVGILSAGPGTATHTRYFVGDFDGRTFSCPQDDLGRRADHGPDFYAAQAWAGAPECTWTAWLGNWGRALAPATSPATWRGALALPRTLSLVTPGPTLRQRPAADLGAHLTRCRTVSARVGPGWLAVTDLDGPVDVDLMLEADLDDDVQVAVLDEHRPVAVLRWSPGEGVLRLDLAGPDAGSGPYVCEVPPRASLALRLVHDETTFEAFADDGLAVFSAALGATTGKAWLAMRSAAGTARAAGTVRTAPPR